MLSLITNSGNLTQHCFTCLYKPGDLDHACYLATHYANLKCNQLISSDFRTHLEEATSLNQRIVHNNIWSRAVTLQSLGRCTCSELRRFAKRRKVLVHGIQFNAIVNLQLIGIPFSVCTIKPQLLGTPKS